jgi:hypothetical protein
MVVFDLDRFYAYWEWVSVANKKLIQQEVKYQICIDMKFKKVVFLEIW